VKTTPRVIAAYLGVDDEEVGDVLPRSATTRFCNSWKRPDVRHGHIRRRR